MPPTPDQLLRLVLGPRTAAALLRTDYPPDSLAKAAAEAGRDVLGMRVDGAAFAGAAPLPPRAEQAVRHLASLAKARADREVLSRVQRLLGRADPVQKADPTPHVPPDPKGPPDRQPPETPLPPKKTPPTVQPPKQRPRTAT